jgi:competence protein ComEC
VFLLITGFSPSIVRASIVAGLGLLAWYFGRTFNPILLIVFTAALTAGFNPYYVWGDIGWYLSFLAFFGVLVLAPLLTIKIFKQKEIGGLKMVPIESFAAQILTLPLIMFIFSRFSLVGLLANILVVPLVPFAMFFSLFAGLAGMYIPSIAPWIALPARIILDLIIWISSFFAKVPNALVDTKLSLVGLIALYVIMIIFIIGLRKNSQFVTIKQRLINSNEAK